MKTDPTPYRLAEAIARLSSLEERLQAIERVPAEHRDLVGATLVQVFACELSGAAGRDEAAAIQARIPPAMRDAACALGRSYWRVRRLPAVEGKR